MTLFPRYLMRFGFFWGILTFLKVEVLRRGKLKLKEIRSPIFLRYGTSDIKVFREVFLFNEYRLSIPPPKTILDGGANIGLASVYFANVFPDALIIAVEPDEQNFRMLEKNTQQYANVKRLKSALWPVNTTLKIRNVTDSAWAFQVAEAAPGDPDSFEAISIDQVMNNFNIHHFDLLKLDVEGAERDIFRSHYNQWMNRVSHMVIELHDWAVPDASRCVFRTIAEYTFVARIVNGMLLFSKTS